ncbi:MAG: hypothetical protein KDI83_06630 [Gammaproteobacteria bacterium]|nr:hypothetical protein [Gammaproteobacteria bacterium]
MITTDDPLLALIVRFVISEERDKRIDEEFIQRQLATMREYLERFPTAEKQSRAMEWIERHAANYRQEWQKQVLPRQAAEKRCSDCPLAATGGEQHCDIHREWIQLLQNYLKNQIDSRVYVQEALELLRRHKDQLRFRQANRVHENRGDLSCHVSPERAG